MPTVAQDNNSRLGQQIYNTKVFKPTFEGYHYKFSILLPTSVIRNGKPDQVFTKEDFKKLNIQFNNDFGGFTRLKVVGEWLNPQKRLSLMNICVTRFTAGEMIKL